MRMRCSEIRARLDPYADGALSDDERVTVERHLERCSECRALARSDEELAQALADLPDVSCPDSVVRRILDATVGRPEPIGPIDRVRALLVPHRWKAALPVLLGASVIVLLVLSHPFERPVTPQPSASEVRLAEKQARWALSYIVQKIDEDGRQRTGEFVQNELPVAIRASLRRATPDLRGD